MDYWKKLRQAVGKETLIMPGAAGAISQNGKILLIRNKGLNKWQIPGGLQEVGEPIQQTVQREIKEELGLEMTAGPLISVFSEPKWDIELSNGDKIQQLTFFFLMEGEISPIRMQASEVAAYEFFAPTEIPEDTMDCCKQKVSDWARYNGEVMFR